MKKNRRKRTHQVCLKREKRETPKKRESVLTVSIEIPESQNNIEKIRQKALKLIASKELEDEQLLTMNDSVTEQNNSSEREILNPASASPVC